MEAIWLRGAQVFSAVVFLVCGTLVFLLRPDRSSSWGIFSFFLNISIFLSTAGQTSPLISLIHLLSYSLLAPSALHMGLTLFEEPAFFLNRPWRYFLLYLPLGVLPLALTIFNRGQGLALVIILAAAAMICLVYLAFRGRYQSSDPMVRQRARLILLAFGLVALSAAVSLPTSLTPLFFSLSIFPITIAYGAMRHNLFEVDEIIKRSMLYLISIGVIAGLYGLFLWLSNLYLEGLIFSQNKLILLSIILFFLFYSQSLKQPIQSSLDQIFYRKNADYQKVTARAREKLSVIMDLELLTNTVKNIITENLMVENAEILLSDQKNRSFASLNGIAIPDNLEVVKLLEQKKRLISKNDLLNDPKLKAIRNKSLAQMAKLEAVYLQPLSLHEKMIGIISLGKIKSEASFNLRDITFLSFLANQTSIALENAKLYDSAGRAARKIEEINQELESKVRERTGELDKKNQETIEANEKIADATEHKAVFLANMSHELRTPLNGILGFTDLLSQGIYGKIPETVSSPLLKLSEDGRKLLRTINNILDYSKIEAGKMQLQKEKISPLKIIEEVVAEAAPEAAKKNLIIETSLGQNPGDLTGDPNRIKQVLSNLVGNAVKFTEKGKITVSLSSRNKQLTFTVADQGPGISSDDQNAVFRGFEAEESYLKTEDRGAKLGLAISKSLAELQGGSLSIKSQRGKGSTFSLNLPQN